MVLAGRAGNFLPVYRTFMLACSLMAKMIFQASMVAALAVGVVRGFSMTRETMAEADLLRSRLQQLKAALASSAMPDTAVPVSSASDIPAVPSGQADDAGVSSSTSADADPGGVVRPARVAPEPEHLAVGPEAASDAVAGDGTPATEAAGADAGKAAAEALVDPAPVALQGAQAAVAEKQAASSGQSSASSAGPSADLLEETATLLNVMSRPESIMAPAERALALDLLTQRLAQVGQSMLLAAVDRVCSMRHPPRQLLEILLKKCAPAERERLLQQARLPEDLLMQLAATDDVATLRCLARRNRLSSCVVGRMLRHAPAEVLPKLLNNEGVVLEHEDWRRLAQRLPEAGQQLAAAMARRADLPVWLALEVFWQVDASLRASLLRRFATQSEMLKELLRIAGMRLVSREDFLQRLYVALGGLAEGGRRLAAEMLAEATGLERATLLRILRDEGGEALAVLSKAHGLTSSEFATLLESLRTHHASARWAFLQQPQPVMALHDALGINRARVILLYWQWQDLRTGPYAPVQEMAGDSRTSAERAETA